MTDNRILLVGSVFTGMQYGSYEVMRRLLWRLDPQSFGIVSLAWRSDADYAFADRTHVLGLRKLPGGKLGAVVSIIQTPFVALSAFLRLRKQGFKSLVAVHPSMDSLIVGLGLSRMLRIPFYPYLHDTIVEAQEKTRMAPIARWVQKRVFSGARKILVVSEGMKAYYFRTYGVNAVVIPHIYSDEIAVRPSETSERTLFWSGGIYGLNDHAVLRVVRAATRLGVVTRITAPGGAALARVEKWKREGLLVEPVYYPKRSDYLAALRRQGAHVLALNAPTESEFGAGELATIFPTKTPDYLASGRPILVYCPEDYELARYFKKYDCGIVVSREEEIEEAIRQVLAPEVSRPHVVSALAKMDDFSAERVSSAFVAAQM